MLWNIIRKELMDTFYSLKFVFTFLLCSVLIILSVFTGIDNYLTDKKEYEAAVAMDMSNLESQPSHQSLAMQGLKIRKPPSVLSTVVAGIQGAVGRVATVNTVNEEGITDSKLNANPVYAIFGELDLAFIVKIVLSLLALLYTFDAVCGEKERGTLKLSLANSLPRDQLLLGKAIGSFVSLLIALAVPFMFALLILAVDPDVVFSTEDWQRIGMLSLLFLLYILVFFSVGLMVSALSSRPSTSFLALLVAWVCFVSVIPKAAVVVAGKIYPAPAVHEVTAQKDAFMQDMHSSAREELQKWVAEHANERAQEPQAYKEKFSEYMENSEMQAIEKITEHSEALDAEYRARQLRQQMIAFSLSRISPASALMFASMSLAGTGIEEHQRFLDSVREYRPVWTRWAAAGVLQNMGLTLPKPDLSDMPRHSYEPESIGDSIKRTIPDFAVLMLLALVFFAGAYVAFLRYDVR